MAAAVFYDDLIKYENQLIAIERFENANKRRDTVYYSNVNSSNELYTSIKNKVVSNELPEKLEEEKYKDLYYYGPECREFDRGEASQEEYNKCEKARSETKLLKQKKVKEILEEKFKELLSNTLTEKQND